MSLIARLGVVLGINSSEFVKGIEDAEKKTKRLKQDIKDLHNTTESLKTAFTVASAAFVGFAGHAINAADEIQDLADANEITTGKILELKHALELSGGDAGKIDVLFTKFTGAINEAAQGSDKLRDSFKELGISTRDIGFLSNQQLLDKAFSGLSKIEDVTTRNALATELFGKAAKSVDFTQMSKNAEDLAGHYKDQEAAIKAAADAAQKMKSLFHEIEMAALLAVKPVIDLFNKIPTEHKVEVMTKAFQALGIAMGVAFGVTAVKGVMQLAGALRALTVTNPWLLALTAAGGAAAYLFGDKLFGGAEDKGEPAFEFGDNKGGQKRSMELSARDKMILKYEELIKEAKKYGDVEQSRILFKNKYDVSELQLEGQKFKLTQEQFEKEKLRLDYYKQVNDLATASGDKFRDAAKQLELAPPEEHAQAKKLYDEKYAAIEKIYNAELKALNNIQDEREKNLNAEYERQKSWAAGWDEAFKRYTEAAERSSDRGREAFQMVMQSMDSALRNFVETGKLNFKDLVGSIVKDLIFMSLKAQATGLFRMGMSAIFGGGGSIGGSGMGSLANMLMSGKASGGYIDRPTLVGENGPELFVPRSGGTVIPNGSWQGMAANSGGGLTVNGTYIANMSAIDTQSATQFLVSNKNTIWASYQSANRSVPISR
jgi:lambda family phage tail tape measure protein